MPRHVHRFDELVKTRSDFKKEVINFFSTHSASKTAKHFNISESTIYRFTRESLFKKSTDQKQKERQSLNQSIRPSLQDVLEKFYKAEVNVTIRSFFDSKWEFLVGDEINGYSDSSNYISIVEGIDFLEQWYSENIESKK